MIEPNEIFDIEMQGWCKGIELYPGEIFPGLVHSVIKELGPSIESVLKAGFAFNILALAQNFSRATKERVAEQEIAFSILAQLPNPKYLTEEGKFALAQVIDQVEQVYGGALSRLQKKWQHES